MQFTNSVDCNCQQSIFPLFSTKQKGLFGPQARATKSKWPHLKLIACVCGGVGGGGVCVCVQVCVAVCVCVGGGGEMKGGCGCVWVGGGGGGGAVALHYQELERLQFQSLIYWRLKSRRDKNGRSLDPSIPSSAANSLPLGLNQWWGLDLKLAWSVAGHEWEMVLVCLCNHSMQCKSITKFQLITPAFLINCG